MTSPDEIKKILSEAMIDDNLKQSYAIGLAQARRNLTDAEFEDLLEKVKDRITEKEKELN